MRYGPNRGGDSYMSCCFTAITIAQFGAVQARGGSPADSASVLRVVMGSAPAAQVELSNPVNTNAMARKAQAASDPITSIPRRRIRRVWIITHAPAHIRLQNGHGALRARDGAGVESSAQRLTTERRCDMKRMVSAVNLVVAIGLAVASGGALAQIAKNVAAKSPWGPADEIGTLNMMSDNSRLDVLRQVSGGKVYDLGVDLFVGMPTCCTPFGDPTFQIFITHAPAQDPSKELLSYSGDGVSMYTHTGTHIDTLNHFGLHGKIWNQVSSKDALGVRGWTKSGADKYPPIIARGVLIDVARAKSMTHLPTSYAITVADLQDALKKQATTLKAGDVVLTRTGAMRLWPDPDKYRLADQA